MSRQEAHMPRFYRNKREKAMDIRKKEYFKVRTWIYYEAQALGYSIKDMIDEMRDCGF